MIFVTYHACEQFVQRVAPCTIAEARAAILSHSKALEAAVGFGCEVVRCGGGERLVLSGDAVVTVYGRDMLPRQCRRGGVA